MRSTVHRTWTAGRGRPAAEQTVSASRLPGSARVGDDEDVDAGAV